MKDALVALAGLDAREQADILNEALGAITHVYRQHLDEAWLEGRKQWCEDERMAWRHAEAASRFDGARDMVDTEIARATRSYLEVKPIRDNIKQG